MRDVVDHVDKPLVLVKHFFVDIFIREFDAPGSKQHPREWELFGIVVLVLGQRDDDRDVLLTQLKTVHNVAPGFAGAVVDSAC